MTKDTKQTLELLDELQDSCKDAQQAIRLLISSRRPVHLRERKRLSIRLLTCKDNIEASLLILAGKAAEVRDDIAFEY